MRPSRPKKHSEWTPRSLTRIGNTLDGQSVETVLRWGLDTFSPDICLATSFGPQSIVLMHHISKIRPEIAVFYLDTELLFPETYALRDELSERLGMTFTRVPAELSVEQQASRFGSRLWAHDPDQCCHLRKVLPLRRFLATKKAWITGIRNGHSTGRAKISQVEWDTANGVVKLNPLVRWRGEQVWDYINDQRLPFNPLHLEGYPSIGCQPCTRSVRPGEDPRAGRWSGFNKNECGIHELPRSPVLRIGQPTKESAR